MGVKAVRYRQAHHAGCGAMGNKTLDKKGYTCNSRPSRRQTRHPRRDTTGVKGSQNPREGGRTIQERGQWELTGTTGGKTVGKADTPSKKGTLRAKTPEKRHTIQEGVQRESKKGYNRSQDRREGRHTIQEEVQWESRLSRRRTHHPRRCTKGVKTLEKADTPRRTP